MPKTDINYNDTHFYKLCCKDPTITDIYIGHTTDFTRRKYQHKSRCCNEKDKDHHTYNYKFVRDSQGWNNWDMVLIETLKIEDALHARKTEREFIEKLGATLNKQIPSRSPTEYCQDNRDKINEQQNIIITRIKKYKNNITKLIKTA